ncbi:hypothetical protein MYX06_02730 [Patescibacteria group bacterium AH-259-L05]|nr:hypothetical protein [Patescibacteria group bacterium AH-259-L05]
MGRNILGMDDAIAAGFNVRPLEALQVVSFSEETLEKCKDTHLLVADFGLSILNIRKMVKKELFHDHEGAWYNKQSFARKREKPAWRLIYKDAVDYTDKTWNEQVALLEEYEEVPRARVMVYTTILHYLTTKERLFENLWIRSKDVPSHVHGYHVIVGFFSPQGLSIGRWKDNEAFEHVGLAVTQQF